MCDLLFSRYGANADRILCMPPKRGYEFYVKGQQEVDNDRIFMRWINGYQQSMSFVDFKRQITGGETELSEPRKEQTEEEILEKVKGILRGNINGNI